MEIKTLPLDGFMERFGEQLFEGAMQRMNPEYRGDRPDLTQAIARANLGRTLFPAQRYAAEAAHVHLEERSAKMLFLEAEMGCGKTTIATVVNVIAGRPQRTIVVCPPHLVGKWAREIRTIVPAAKVVKINSSSANRILERAATQNPGRPKQHEFYVIGRVRLRMDFGIEPALVCRKHFNTEMDSEYERFHCPDCGRAPVKWESLGKDETIPPEAVVEKNDDDETSTKNGFWMNIGPCSITRTTFCEKVVNVNGDVEDGCGSALWQAKRNQPNFDPVKNAVKSLQQLPGVGPKLAKQLGYHAGAKEIVEALENGDIPKALDQRIGPVRRKRIQQWLDENSFALQASDFAPVSFIKKRLPKGWIDYLDLDECHEMKGDNSAQGVAYGILAGLVRKVICLTGTLVDGYAQSLHPLLFRADPKRMLEAGYGADDGARFQWEMGVIKEVEIEDSSGEHAQSRSRRKVRRQRRNLPGLHPTVITRLLLPNTVFLSLADIEHSIQDLQEPDEKPVRLLPSYREVFAAVPMDSNQQSAVKNLSDELMLMLKQALAQGYGQTIMSTIISTLLRYPDDCFRPLKVSTRSSTLATRAPVRTPDGLLPKERFMLDLAKREISEGRKMVVFTTYTDRRDLAGRYKEVLERGGLKVTVLRSTVPTDQREQWMQERVAEGYEVIVCNPELVKTGLDLYDFPTLMFAQTGYRVDTILQASRRSWRIGQQRAVRVYIAGYQDSPQMVALKLVAKKIRVANQAKGDIADTGLSTLDDDEEASAMQAIANAILDERRDRSHDAITGQITSLCEDDCSAEFGADPIAALHAIIERATSEDEPEVVAEIREAAEAVVDMSSASSDLFADIDIFVVNEEHPATVQAGEAEPTTDGPDVNSNQKTTPKRVVLIDVLEGKGRKRGVGRREVALEDAPTGSQMALF